MFLPITKAGTFCDGFMVRYPSVCWVIALTMSTFLSSNGIRFMCSAARTRQEQDEAQKPYNNVRVSTLWLRCMLFENMFLIKTLSFKFNSQFIKYQIKYYALYFVSPLAIFNRLLLTYSVTTTSIMLPKFLTPKSGVKKISAAFGVRTQFFLKSHIQIQQGKLGNYLLKKTEVIFVNKPVNFNGIYFETIRLMPDGLINLITCVHLSNVDLSICSEIFIVCTMLMYLLTVISGVYFKEFHKNKTLLSTISRI